jgi:hypothetical protein
MRSRLWKLVIRGLDCFGNMTLIAPELFKRLISHALKHHLEVHCPGLDLEWVLACLDSGADRFARWDVISLGPPPVSFVELLVTSSFAANSTQARDKGLLRLLVLSQIFLSAIVFLQLKGRLRYFSLRPEVADLSFLSHPF